MRKRRWIFTLTVLLLALAAAAFGAAEDDTDRQTRLADRQQLRIAFQAGNAVTFDPHKAVSTADLAVVGAIFNGLVRHAADGSGKFEPELAERWETSPDGLTWRFHLRREVRFHPPDSSFDGSEGEPLTAPLTSDDVVYSLRRAADPDRSRHARAFAGLRFAAADPLIVEVVAPERIAAPVFLQRFAEAGGIILSRRVAEEKGDTWVGTHPVGTGPFRFVAHLPERKTELAANPAYFRGAPALQAVTVRYIPSPRAREFALRTGEIDMIEGVNNAKWLERVSEIPEVTLAPAGPREIHMLHFNLNGGALADIRVRKAVAYALDRSALAGLLGRMLAEPAYLLLQEGMPPKQAPKALTDAGAIYDANRDKAKALLKEAGFADGISLTAVADPRAGASPAALRAVRSELEKAGIDVTFTPYDPQALSGGEGRLADLLYIADVSAPDPFLTSFFHSGSIGSTGLDGPWEGNFSHYGAADADGDGKPDSVDEAIEKARSSSNTARRRRLWRDAQIEILKDVAAVPLIRVTRLFPMRSYVDPGDSSAFSRHLPAPHITEKTRMLAR